MKQTLKACSIALALVLAPLSLAQTHLKVGDTDSFMVLTRFTTHLERLEQSTEIVQIELTFDLTTLVKHITDEGTFITARIDEAGYYSIEDAGHQRYALAYHTDPARQNSEYFVEMLNIEDLKGKTFEFVLRHDGEDPELVQPISQILRSNFDVKFLKQLINEKLISRGIRWYFSLAADKPDEWTEALPFYLRPDGHFKLEPHYTTTNTDGPIRNIDISGEVSYEDMRDIHEFVRGLVEMRLIDHQITGHASWNTELQRTDSLSLAIKATLEPRDIDPLGKRIYRKYLTQEYTVRRID
jgi:hypothetical protein